MELSEKAKEIYSRISGTGVKLGELRKIAADIKKDHGLAMQLWYTGNYFARQLAILIMDKKMLTAEVVEKLVVDISKHDAEQQNQLIDWLMANQLSKDKKTITMMESWMDSPSSLQRRIFWYYQARLRWVGQVPPPNTDFLLPVIEDRITGEVPEVQWAMNFTAGQIGVFQPEYRARCIELGERTGLYKGDFVHKGCTPSYLPEFIATQLDKQKNNTL